MDSTSSAQLKGRAIVSHVGVSRDGGTWKCSKDKNLNTCYHIKEASKLLPEEFGELLDNVEVAEGLVSTDICTLCESWPHWLADVC